eukprot:GEMP01009429.1.p1 GENE.GEMP01009429.1~~GEMP01009429.1.p1  ORF type:complete len:674 (+),score=125.06 GEMP01009429.1:124-2145(+)
MWIGQDDGQPTRIDDLPDDPLISIFTMCGALGMANGGCTCRTMAAAALVTGERLFSTSFGIGEGKTTPVPTYLLNPRSQLFKLLDRARSPVESHQKEIFSWAAAFGYFAYIDHKMQAQSDILRGRILNQRNSHGATPLLLATKHSRLEVVRILIAYRAEVNSPGPRGSALLQACKIGDAAIVRVLVEAKAEAVARRTPCPDGVLSPLEAAVQSLPNSERVECLRLVCSALKDEVDERESCSARMTFLHVCETGDMPYVRVLLEQQVGVKPPAEDVWRRRGTARFDGATPLLLAAQAGHDDLAECLLAAKVAGDINAVLLTSKTALYLCAERGNAHLARVLLSKFASLDVQTCTGRSALFAAVEHCHEEAVHAICEFIDVKHITMRTKGEEGVSPFMLAEKRGKTSLIIPMLEAYHRQVRRRQILRSFGDIIDDVTHPYLSQKVDQYRDLMFRNRDRGASCSSQSNPNRNVNTPNRYRRVMDQRVSEGKSLRLSTQLDLHRSPREDPASPRRPEKPRSAPRALSTSMQNVARESCKVPDTAASLRQSLPTRWNPRASSRPRDHAKMDRTTGTPGTTQRAASCARSLASTIPRRNSLYTRHATATTSCENKNAMRAAAPSPTRRQANAMVGVANTLRQSVRHNDKPVGGSKSSGVRVVPQKCVFMNAAEDMYDSD